MQPLDNRCAYHKLDAGIREFVFLEKSPQAVGEWIQHLNHIMRDDLPRPDTQELLLFDIRQHVPGAVYTARSTHGASVINRTTTEPAPPSCCVIRHSLS
ncbi:MAG: hypothetical protein LCI00_09930 [Chloroflexi bacterium]|nr:hypothetical protein [Chloroflexota bacterium]MCC6892954.1 hypothetical protein [Anaerolineae bacterium]